MNELVEDYLSRAANWLQYRTVDGNAFVHTLSANVSAPEGLNGALERLLMNDRSRFRTSSSATGIRSVSLVGFIDPETKWVNAVYRYLQERERIGDLTKQYWYIISYAVTMPMWPLGAAPNTFSLVYNDARFVCERDHSVDPVRWFVRLAQAAPAAAAAAPVRVPAPAPFRAPAVVAPVQLANNYLNIAGADPVAIQQHIDKVAAYLASVGGSADGVAIGANVVRDAGVPPNKVLKLKAMLENDARFFLTFDELQKTRPMTAHLNPPAAAAAAAAAAPVAAPRIHRSAFANQFINMAIKAYTDNVAAYLASVGGSKDGATIGQQKHIKKPPGMKAQDLLAADPRFRLEFDPINVLLMTVHLQQPPQQPQPVAPAHAVVAPPPATATAPDAPVGPEAAQIEMVYQFLQQQASIGDHSKQYWSEICNKVGIEAKIYGKMKSDPRFLCEKDIDVKPNRSFVQLNDSPPAPAPAPAVDSVPPEPRPQPQPEGPTPLEAAEKEYVAKLAAYLEDGMAPEDLILTECPPPQLLVEAGLTLKFFAERHHERFILVRIRGGGMGIAVVHPEVPVSPSPAPPSHLVDYADAEHTHDGEPPFAPVSSSWLVPEDLRMRVLVGGRDNKRYAMMAPLELKNKDYLRRILDICGDSIATTLHELINDPSRTVQYDLYANLKYITTNGKDIVREAFDLSAEQYAFFIAQVVTVHKLRNCMMHQNINGTANTASAITVNETLEAVFRIVGEFESYRGKREEGSVRYDGVAALKALRKQFIWHLQWTAARQQAMKDNGAVVDNNNAAQNNGNEVPTGNTDATGVVEEVGETLPVSPRVQLEASVGTSSNPLRYDVMCEDLVDMTTQAPPAAVYDPFSYKEEDTSRGLSVGSSALSTRNNSNFGMFGEMNLSPTVVGLRDGLRASNEKHVHDCLLQPPDFAGDVTLYSDDRIAITMKRVTGSTAVAAAEVLNNCSSDAIERTTRSFELSWINKSQHTMVTHLTAEWVDAFGAPSGGGDLFTTFVDALMTHSLPPGTTCPHLVTILGKSPGDWALRFSLSYVDAFRCTHSHTLAFPLHVCSFGAPTDGGEGAAEGEGVDSAAALVGPPQQVQRYVCVGNSPAMESGINYPAIFAVVVNQICSVLTAMCFSHSISDGVSSGTGRTVNASTTVSLANTSFDARVVVTVQHDEESGDDSLPIVQASFYSADAVGASSVAGIFAALLQKMRVPLADMYIDTVRSTSSSVDGSDLGSDVVVVSYPSPSLPSSPQRTLSSRVNSVNLSTATEVRYEMVGPLVDHGEAAAAAAAPAASVAAPPASSSPSPSATTATATDPPDPTSPPSAPLAPSPAVASAPSAPHCVAAPTLDDPAVKAVYQYLRAKWDAGDPARLEWKDIHPAVGISKGTFSALVPCQHFNCEKDTSVKPTRTYVSLNPDLLPAQ